MIVFGSWITHSTTAEIYNDYSNQQALAFAEAMPNSGIALQGSLPDQLFVTPMQVTHGPISNSFAASQSPAAHIFTHTNEDLGQQQATLAETSHTVKRGDTIGRIFSNNGLGVSLPHQISEHPVAQQLVSLTVGQDLTFGHDANGELKQLSYSLNSLQDLIVDIEEGSIAEAKVIDVPFQTVDKTVSGEISTSLYDAALKAGLSINLVMEMVKIFGWDIDFVLDIRKGDTFHVVFEEKQLNGEKLSDGNILAADFTTQNHTYRAIRFTDADGVASYYNPQGQSMLGTFLRSPVEFSRISSRFGKRKHPILKKWRAHKGVDYAANRGTPIRATASGKVVHAGTKGGYGRTVILRHAGRFTTLYGHMNGYAKGIKAGSRVEQGDTIGYIGSSGLATGPHLHYEFRLDGVHRDPLTFKTPKASSIHPDMMAEFTAVANTQLAKLDQLTQQYRVAKATPMGSSAAH